MATAFGTTYRFRPPGTPGRIARVACLATGGLLLVTGVVAIARAASGDAWVVRFVLPPEGSSAQPQISDVYPGAIETVVWLGTLAFIATAICWLVWQVRATENVWAVPGVPMATRKPGMAVLWWFIPFANLGMPYACVRELRAVSAARAGTQPRPAILPVWWLLFLAAALAGIVASVWPWIQVVAQVVDQGGDAVLGRTYVVDVSSAVWSLGVWHLLLAGAAFAAAAVVSEIERAQGAIAAAPTIAETSFPGSAAPPRPDVG